MSKQKIYPFAVAVVRSKETNLISKDRLMQMADAPTAEEAAESNKRKADTVSFR